MARVNIHEMVQDYDFRPDGGAGYTPTEAEQALLEDFGEDVLLAAQPTGGVAAIAEERQRQISEEGWTAEHDAAQPPGVLALAATCYAAAAAFLSRGGILPRNEPPPASWPWDREWWKPSGDPRRNLVKAGALIAAQIDRIDADRARGAQHA